VLRIESRKSLIVLVAALFVFNLFLGFHHQGSLGLASPDAAVKTLGISARANGDAEHSSSCRVCQWTCAERTEVPRPLLLGATTAIAESAVSSLPTPASERIVSLLRTRAPPRLLA
jgi:hypothetical protein